MLWANMNEYNMDYKSANMEWIKKKYYKVSLTTRYYKVSLTNKLREHFRVTIPLSNIFLYFHIFPGWRHQCVVEWTPNFPVSEYVSGSIILGCSYKKDKYIVQIIY